jgi:hypothetical protein
MTWLTQEYHIFIGAAFLLGHQVMAGGLSNGPVAKGANRHSKTCFGLTFNRFQTADPEA